MYFGLLSRPFFTEPVPFLCAHSMTAVRGALALERDDERRKDDVEIFDESAKACMALGKGARRRVKATRASQGRSSAGRGYSDES